MTGSNAWVIQALSYLEPQRQARASSVHVTYPKGNAASL